MTTLPHISILGTGAMGSAILAGLVAPGVEVTGGVTATNRTSAKAADLAKLPGVNAIALEEIPEGNRAAAAESDIVLIGVKPAMVPDLLDEIADVLRPGTIVVSVAAGVTLETFERLLPENVAVVRAMPNTPAIVRLAVTGISAGSRADAGVMATVRALFETVGDVLEIPENQIDALSTISGSGPAYVFALIEALTEAAIGKGFTREQADLMVQGTFRGSSELLAHSDQSAAQLRIAVTSPGGTTAEALSVMDHADLPEMFVRATDAALARAAELGRA